MVVMVSSHARATESTSHMIETILKYFIHHHPLYVNLINVLQKSRLIGLFVHFDDYKTFYLLNIKCFNIPIWYT